MILRFELFVKNPKKSLDFYTKVLGFKKLQHSEDYFPIKNGEVIVGIGTIKGLRKNHYFQPEVKNQRLGLGVEIVLEVTDIQKTYQKVRKTKYPTERKLGKRSWGLTDFRLVDPDGYYIRITSAN